MNHGGELRHPNRSWRADETYIKIAGSWAYLYRAVDSAGGTIDFMLSPTRDLTADKLFLRFALSGTGHRRPRVINVDGHPAYASAIFDLKQSGELGRRCRCRPSFYLNNIIEQDHRFISPFNKLVIPWMFARIGEPEKPGVRLSRRCAEAIFCGL